AYTVKVNFDGTNGAFPIHNTLVEAHTLSGLKAESVSANSLNVYPNPSSGRFSLSTPKAVGAGTIEIYNTIGAKVYASETFSPQVTNEIDLLSQPAGVYLITLHNGTKTYSIKVVKE
ncbi:MAG: T9SS type A sorting domain-containing protein, partial [Legionellales bacterium]